MEYFLHIVIIVFIYIILTVSLDLIVGYTGLLSISHAAFFCVGAYVGALFCIKFNTPFLVNCLLAFGVSSIIGILLGLPSLKVKGEMFILVSFAFQIVINNLVNNMDWLTGGPMGIPGIPPPRILGFIFDTKVKFLGLLSFFCFLVVSFSFLITKSPFGRVLKAIREDEILVFAFGKNVSVFKILIFSLSSGFCAIGGVFYAQYISFVDPSTFTIMESIFLISIVIIGGAGSIWGPIFGSVILISLPEFIRFVGLPNSISANLRGIIYGILLLIILYWKPLGIFGQFDFLAVEDGK